LPSPGVYLAVAYHQGGQLAMVFSDLAGNCSFLTICGSKVVRFGDLGKVNCLDMGDTSVLFSKDEL
jgi:hypothetical protein